MNTASLTRHSLRYTFPGRSCSPHEADDCVAKSREGLPGNKTYLLSMNLLDFIGIFCILAYSISFVAICYYTRDKEEE